MIASDHIKPMLRPSQRKTIVNWCVDILLNRTHEFDTIVVSGHSMTMIGSIIAHILDKKLLLVRKYETINSEYMIEGQKYTRCVMIDDCICTGDSIIRCNEAIEEFEGDFVGFLLWSDQHKSEVYHLDGKTVPNIGFGIELCDYN